MIGIMPIDNALATCGITTEQGRAAFHQEGFENVRDFAVFDDDDIKAMCKAMAARAQNATENGYRIGALHVKRV